MDATGGTTGGVEASVGTTGGFGILEGGTPEATPLDGSVDASEQDHLMEAGGPSADGRVAPDAQPSDAGADFPFPPLVADGEPLPAQLDTWTTTEFSDAPCRDGSPSGVKVRRGSVDKLMIYLEGGGRCAEPQTCSINPANIQGGALVRSFAAAGVLDFDNPENPVRDWHSVYVFYCTGDRHGGANPDADVMGVGPQQMVGQLNMQKFLNRIVPTFPDVDDVLLTGHSAGGFGAAYNSVLVQRAFPDVKVKTIIDSAPFVSSDVFTSCDQELTRTLYRAEETFLGDCGAACPNPNDYWFDYGRFLAEVFHDRPWGLISPTEDAVERAFFGIGLDDCTGSLDLLWPGVPAAPFRSDLLEFRDGLQAFPSFSAFYPEGDGHTLIPFDEFYTATVDGVRLVDWFGSIVNGQAPGHAGP